MALPAGIRALLDPSLLEAPNVAVCSSADLEGGLGETCVAADASGLVLVSRRLGEDYRKVRFTHHDLDDVSLVPDGLYLNLNLTTGGRTMRLRFASWSGPELERLVDLWQTASDRSSRRGGPADGPLFAAAARLGSPAAISPPVALSASLHAMAQADGSAGELELAEVERVLGDPALSEAGARLLRESGLDGLLAGLGHSLSTAQKRCLFANLLGVAMVDGLLRSAEQELADRFSTALGFADRERMRIQSTVLAQHYLAVLVEEPARGAAPPGPTPLRVFCAAILVLVGVDGAESEEERAVRERLVDDPAAWEAAAALVAERGPAGVESCLGRLNPAQRRCLLANLIVVGMCDGWLRSSEQAQLADWRRAMGFSEPEYDAICQVLRDQAEVSVFS